MHTHSTLQISYISYGSKYIFCSHHQEYIVKIIVDPPPNLLTIINETGLLPSLQYVFFSSCMFLLFEFICRFNQRWISYPIQTFFIHTQKIHIIAYLHFPRIITLYQRSISYYYSRHWFKLYTWSFYKIMDGSHDLGWRIIRWICSNYSRKENQSIQIFVFLSYVNIIANDFS